MVSCIKRYYNILCVIFCKSLTIKEIDRDREQSLFVKQNNSNNVWLLVRVLQNFDNFVNNIRRQRLSVFAYSADLIAVSG